MGTNLQSLLAAAVIRILRPIVRVLIRHELSHAEFSELARHAYVEEAYASFVIKGRKMTYARAAVLTGLSRKEVRRLIEHTSDEVAVNSTPNRAVRVINGWLTDEEFQENGVPVNLPLHGEIGSFAALVARYSGDISLGAVVDELERVGVVSRPDKSTVVLESHGYIPHSDELEKVRIMSICTADLLDTAVHNLDADAEQRRLQRQMSCDDVPESIADDFRKEAAARSSDLLTELQNYLTNKLAEQTEESSAEPKHRIGLGVYYHDNNDVDITEVVKDESYHEET